jgi:hypothetical protein
MFAKQTRETKMSIVKVLSESQYRDHPAGAVIARQGDVVLFKPHDGAGHGPLIESGEKNRVVLAHGEVTGHAHAFYVSEAKEPKKAFELFECNAQLNCNTRFDGKFLRLHERSFLRHEEHSPFSLPPGDYIVVIQNEGDEMGELRSVAD